MTKIARGDEIFSIAFYYEDSEPFYFESRYALVRLGQTGDWYTFDNFDFNRLFFLETYDFMQFLVTLEWNPDAQPDVEDEPWKRVQDQSYADRTGIITLRMSKVIGIKTVFWNPGDEIPPNEGPSLSVH